MQLILSCLNQVPEAPPAGALSPLAWIIIVAIASVVTTVVPALWYQNKKMYDDLKACNNKHIDREVEVVGLLKVLRLQMEKARGGKPR
jgi:hypothetical protein